MNFLKLYKESSVIEKVTLFLFLVFLITTSIYNRLSIDDLFFQYKTTTTGLSCVLDSQYSRIAAYGLNALVISSSSQFILIIYNIISITAFGVALVHFLKNSYRLTKRDTTYQHKFGLLFFIIVLLCTSAPNEVYFWYTQVSTYLWCMTCVLFAGSILFSGISSNWQILPFFIACVFIGSSSEFLAIQSIMFLIYLIVSKRLHLSNNTNKIILSVGLILLVSSLYITISSPGLHFRALLIEKKSMSDLLFLNTKFTFLYFYRFFDATHILLGLPLALMLILLGAQHTFTFTVKLKHFAYFVIYIFICLLITSYSTNDIAPARSLLLCDIVLLYLISTSVIKFGTWLSKLIRLPMQLGYLAHIHLMVCFLYHSYEAYNYALAYDKREKIITLSQQDPIILKALPATYFIHSCQITRDSLDYRNQHLKLSHNVHVNIINN